MELSEVKSIANAEVIAPFDHRYLNDLPDFQDELPTPEAIAKHLLKHAQAAFKATAITPTACHIIETASYQAIAYPQAIHTLKSNKDKIVITDTLTKKNLSSKQHTSLGIWTETDATVSLTQSYTIHATHCLTNTALTDEEQDSIFGKCQFVHGHEFDIDITVDCGNTRLSNTDAAALRDTISHCLEDWQYKSLNDEVPELQNKLCT